MERTATEEKNKTVEWSALLETALTAPGRMGDTYNRFANYSFGNQILLLMQGVNEPVAGFQRWKKLGRQVQRGSKAKQILAPIVYKERNDKGVLEPHVKGFKLANVLFTLSQTEGDELPPYEPPEWSRELALANLAITEVAFEAVNGNMQGYSIGNEIAINPLAAYPLKTTIHELGHVVLKHTLVDPEALVERHRGIGEFQAESTALLTMNELGAIDQMDQAESRAYIHHWLKGKQPSDGQIKDVFTATDKILKAGRSKPEENE
jgi:hypothetical protein